MQAYSPSQARANLFKIINHAAESHDPVYIIGKHRKSVLIDEEDYRSLLETIYITSVPGMTISILNASKAPLSDFSDTIDWENA